MLSKITMTSAIAAIASQTSVESPDRFASIRRLDLRSIPREAAPAHVEKNCVFCDLSGADDVATSRLRQFFSCNHLAFRLASMSSGRRRRSENWQSLASSALGLSAGTGCSERSAHGVLPRRSIVSPSCFDRELKRRLMASRRLPAVASRRCDERSNVRFTPAAARMWDFDSSG